MVFNLNVSQLLVAVNVNDVALALEMLAYLLAAVQSRFLPNGVQLNGDK